MLGANGTPVRDVDAHHPHAAAGRRDQPALGRILASAEAGCDVVEADPGCDRDTVPAPVPVMGHLIAQLLEPVGWEGVVGQLGLLEAANVGFALLQPFLDPLESRPQRVDIPGGDSHGLLRSGWDWREDEKHVRLARDVSADSGDPVPRPAARRQPADRDLEIQRVARHDLTAKASPVDAAEERQAALVAPVGENDRGGRAGRATRPSGRPATPGCPGSGRRRTPPPRSDAIGRSPRPAGASSTISETRRNGGRCGISSSACDSGFTVARAAEALRPCSADRRAGIRAVLVEGWAAQDVGCRSARARPPAEEDSAGAHTPAAGRS